jgi:hypothetical protein
MINVLEHEEQVEILDDMAFALQNLAKDCIQILIKLQIKSRFGNWVGFKPS